MSELSKENFSQNHLHIQLRVTLFSTQALNESVFIRAISFRFKKPPPSPSAPPALSLLFSYELGIQYRSLPLAQEYSQGYIILLRFAASFWQPPINSNKLSPGAIDLISLGLWKLEIGNYKYYTTTTTTTQHYSLHRDAILFFLLETLGTMLGKKPTDGVFELWKLPYTTTLAALNKRYGGKLVKRNVFGCYCGFLV